MLLLSWLAFIVIGKVVTYIGMQFPLPDILERNQKIKKWHECDLCFGVWVYTILSFFMQKELTTVMGFPYTPFLSELITGCSISLLVHLLIMGWKAKFEVIVV